jgi:hypothetical protein
MHAMANDVFNCQFVENGKFDFSKFDIDTAPYELVPDVKRNVSK